MPVRLLILALLGLGACSLPEPKDLVSKRAEHRMSANQLHNLGLAHLQGGDYPECVRVYDKALARKRMVGSYLNQGLCHERSGDAAGAEQAFTAALELRPEDPRAWFGRAQARAARGDTEGAQADRATLTKLDPNYAPGVDDLAARAASALPTPRRAPTGIMGD